MDEAPSVVREQTQITSNLTKTALYGSTQTTIKFTQEYEYPSRLNVYSAPQPDRLGVSPKCTRAAPLWCPMFPHSHEDTMPSQQSARGRSKSSSIHPAWSHIRRQARQRRRRGVGWHHAVASVRGGRGDGCGRHEAFEWRGDEVGTKLALYGILDDLGGPNWVARPGDRVQVRVEEAASRIGQPGEAPRAPSYQIMDIRQNDLEEI